MSEGKRIWAGVILVFLLASLPVLATSLAGEWKGAIEIPGSPLAIVVRLTQESGTWQGNMDIPSQGAFKLPLEDISAGEEKLSFSLTGVPGGAKMEGRLEDGERLSGTFHQGGLAFPFRLGRQTAAALTQLREFIQQARAQWQAPGLAVGIVRDGRVIFEEGFGYRDLEKQLPVTENTLFPIGSCTKAFTALWAGMLAEEGKLDLDKPLAQYIPGFAFENDPLAKYMTTRDLLTHRAGLPRHDLALIYNSQLTREGIMESLRYMKRTGAFRSSFQYSNFNYLIAASLMERLDTTWEQAVTEKILRPLKMSPKLSVKELQTAADYALPYLERQGKVEKVDFLELGAAAPAGGICAKIGDLAKWLAFWLQNGEYEGLKVSPSTVELLTTAQVALSGRGQRVKQLGYAFGWFVDSYRGHYRVYHEGTTAGFSALVAFLPEDGIGIAVLANLQGTPLVQVIAQTALDQLLGLESVNWNEEAKGAYLQQAKLAQELTVFNADMREQGTAPSHELAAYAGTYVHPLYGTISVSLEGETLKAKYDWAQFALRHWHYDTFVGEIDTMGRLQIPLQFQTDLNGQIHEARVSLDPFSSQNLVAFVREKKLKSDLAPSLVGKYLVSGMELEVKATDGALLLAVPGQKVYTLSPDGETSFTIQGLAGYRVEFAPAEGKIVFRQPNGTFSGERVREGATP